MRTTYSDPRRRRGSVLFDALMGLLIIFGLVAGVVTMLSTASTSRAVNGKLVELRLFIQEIESNTPTIKTTASLAMGAYDPVADIWIGGLAGRSALPADFFHGTAVQRASSGLAYVIQLENLDPAVCEKIARQKFENPVFSTHPLNCGTGTLRMARESIDAPE